MGDVGKGLGSIVGGLTGAGSGDRGEARNQSMIANQILQEIAKAPDLSKPLILEQYKQAGVLSPEMEQYITGQEPKAITVDKGLRDVQQQALKQIQDRATGGLSSADRAGLNQMRTQTQSDEEGKLQQILQKYKEQGLGRSGQALAAQLSQAQHGANEESAAADRQAQQAQQAQMAAAAQLGSMGSAMEGQQFGENLANQQAQQQMQRFNIQNQIGQQSRNVASGNQAQQANLANLQGINNANTSQNNAEQLRQTNAQQQQWADNLARAQVQAGGSANLSNYLQKQGDAQATGSQQMWGGIGSIVGQAVTGIPSMGSDPMSGASTQSGTGMQAVKNGSYDDRAYSGLGSFDGGKIPQDLKPLDFKSGGYVPGHAPVPGDHPANDIVPAMLSSGEIVVPRSIAQSPLGKHLTKLIESHNKLKDHFNGAK